ncbi:GIY-YIG nuclease family protein [Celeribacter halophilus]|uniref:GIY-YIG nuclease family protein n=1 Tax=Celeribacter halophilus TaxID=576117 RepID=UPI001C0830B1|nr:GIY-YIG nuclease family protein [Celeribacter halophilus]MBU2891107.1 GIY-YIG nuclease family protein [Celeribacter halophilus]MDO6511006.1 GIY-YIG nuclease family protein [Celeribacter halophilus]
MPKLQYVVYKLTFPNGKIYVGMDIGGSGHSLRYFGSWNNDLVEADFSTEELRDFTLRKEILFESDDKNEVRREEMRLICALQSNNPEIGYNLHPKFRS